MASPVRALLRGLALLEELNMQNGADIATLAKATGLSRGTTYRMMETLSHGGFLRKDSDSGTYWLEPKVRTLSDGYSPESWLLTVAEPRMEAFCRAVTWPISLTIPVQTDMVVMARTDHMSPLKFRSIAVGHRFPMLRSAAGAMYLASLPGSQRRVLLDLAFKGLRGSVSPLIASPDRIEERLIEIARQDFVLFESTQKINALAVPLRVDDVVLGCLSLRIFRSAMANEAVTDQFLQPLRSLARHIAEAVASRSEDSKTAH